MQRLEEEEEESLDKQVGGAQAGGGRPRLYSVGDSGSCRNKSLCVFGWFVPGHRNDPSRRHLTAQGGV